MSDSEVQPMMIDLIEALWEECEPHQTRRAAKCIRAVRYLNLVAFNPRIEGMIDSMNNTLDVLRAVRWHAEMQTAETEDPQDQVWLDRVELAFVETAEVRDYLLYVWTGGNEGQITQPNGEPLESPFLPDTEWKS